MNSLMVIFPYKIDGIWVFDDAATGLVREPFVDVVNLFIDNLTKDIDNAEKGFRLIFSAQPFPGYGLSFKRIREEYDGNWYACNELGNEEGWLCPALFKYFDTAPPALYAKAEAKPVAPVQETKSASLLDFFSPVVKILRTLRR